MSVNDGLSNDTDFSQNLSSNSSPAPYIMPCFFSRPGSNVYTAYNITNILLLLPLYIFILYHGLQQWQKKRSSSSVTSISHSDCFTYNTVIMETFGVVGCILNCWAIYKVNFNVLNASICYFNFNWFGQTFFHILTCAERYLAVVHPITYLSLRNEKGIRIRNICIGCVWLMCVLGMSAAFHMEASIIIIFCFLIFALTIVSFCSVSVLCVLIGPGPGEQVGGRERTDQSKQRAFYTIVVILGVLGLRFTFGLIRMTLFVLNISSNCQLNMCEMWLNMPSSLVLPFLFLQRAGKLKCLKRNQSPGHQLKSHK